MTHIYNFSAGPRRIAEGSTGRKAAAEMLDWHGSGMSVMEMSHARTGVYVDLQGGRAADLRELLAVPDNYKILFMQGGGTVAERPDPAEPRRPQAAAQRPSISFIPARGRAKSIKEAAKYANVNVAASSTTSGAAAQSAWKLTPGAAYLHMCTNETIDGVEYDFDAGVPAAQDGVLLVADMSSHILSRRIDVSKYGVIFAGAQKKHRPGRRDHRHRARRPAGQGAAGLPVGVRLQAGGRQRIDVQHGRPPTASTSPAWCSSG